MFGAVDADADADAGGAELRVARQLAGGDPCPQFLRKRERKHVNEKKQKTNTTQQKKTERNEKKKKKKGKGKKKWKRPEAAAKESVADTLSLLDKKKTTTTNKRTTTQDERKKNEGQRQKAHCDCKTNKPTNQRNVARGMADIATPHAIGSWFRLVAGHSSAVFVSRPRPVVVSFVF